MWRLFCSAALLVASHSPVSALAIPQYAAGRTQIRSRAHGHSLWFHSSVAPLSRTPAWARSMTVGDASEDASDVAVPEQDVEDDEEEFVLFEPAPSSPPTPPSWSPFGVAPQAAEALQDGDDEDDPLQQARVLFYMGISVAPVLFLLPFLSSNGPLVPLDPSNM